MHKGAGLKVGWLHLKRADRQSRRGSGEKPGGPPFPTPAPYSNAPSPHPTAENRAPGGQDRTLSGTLSDRTIQSKPGSWGWTAGWRQPETPVHLLNPLPISPTVGQLALLAPPLLCHAAQGPQVLPPALPPPNRAPTWSQGPKATAELSRHLPLLLLRSPKRSPENSFLKAKGA